jgi:hypothetical protein
MGFEPTASTLENIPPQRVACFHRCFCAPRAHPKQLGKLGEVLKSSTQTRRREFWERITPLSFQWSASVPLNVATARALAGPEDLELCPRREVFVKLVKGPGSTVMVESSLMPSSS